MQNDASKRLGQCVVNFPRQTVPFLGHRQLLSSTSQSVELQCQRRMVDERLRKFKVVRGKLDWQIQEVYDCDFAPAYF